MNKLLFSILTGIDLLLASAAHADDKQLEKRLEVVEAKLERMGALEEENKQLKARLQKTEAKLEKVTTQTLTRPQKVATVAPVRTVERVVAPALIATSPVTSSITPVANSVTSSSNWSGVYAGINAGYGTGEVGSQTSVVDTSNISSSGSGPQYIKGYGTSSADGPVVGGQIGINYKLKNNIILGIETDFDYADINNRLGGSYANNNVTTVSSTFSQFTTNYARSGIDWLGTARLRLGYNLGNFMPYLTGGFAYGGVNNNSLSNMIAGQTTSVIDSQIRTANGGINSSVQTGWASGAGAELIVTENWSIRGEYLFTQLGSLSSNSSGFSSYSSNYYVSALTSYNSSNTGIRWNQSSLGPIGIHQARVGLNYHTDWLKNFSVNTEQR